MEIVNLLSMKIPTINWVLPRPSKGEDYPGKFPLWFEEKLMHLLGHPKTILQPFGGRAQFGFKTDLKKEVEPHVIADAHNLPFKDETFDCIILDPPYSDDYAQELYGTPKKLKLVTYVKEAVRVLKKKGWLVFYHLYEPALQRYDLEMRYRIMLSLGQWHQLRCIVIFSKKTDEKWQHGRQLD